MERIQQAHKRLPEQYPGSAINTSRQLDLFKHVANAYGQSSSGVLDNDRLYQKVAEHAGISTDELNSRVPIGEDGQAHSLLKRQIRWHQQTIKHMGLIERVEGSRGLWRLTDAGEKKLRRAQPQVAMLAFSTDLGIAIWGSHARAFPHLDVPIVLGITSPPYPLRKPRAYGNPPESEYVDFICRALEPVVTNLAPGGSICINVSNDIFEQGSPARSLYLERMIIALHDRLGLKLMDRLVWHNPSKPPGPIQWASKQRVQLNVSWEPVLWFSNDPHLVKSDNRRVLEPHTERHLRLIAAGGERREASFADGAYKVRPSSYAAPTAGRIPRNVLTLGHNCPDHREYRKNAADLGLPSHGAAFPLSLPDFLIRFLSEPGDLVVDPFGGKLTTAKAAENLGRKWMTTEWILEYIRGAAERFSSCQGYRMNPSIEHI